MSILRKEEFSIAMLGLGGNLGDPVQSMKLALQALNLRNDCRIVGVSRLYRTPPLSKVSQAFFYNGCAALQTSLKPQQLLSICLDVERSLKRVRVEHWGPRTIDIDILTYGSCVIDLPTLQVPHPRMTDRGFVLMPLTDIAADLIVAGRAVSHWLSEVDVQGIEIIDNGNVWWR